MAASRAPTFLQRFEALPIIIVFFLLLLLFTRTAPMVFLQPNIYTTFLSTLPPLVLLAAGLTFIIGAGEIDLSFPSIIAFSGFVFALLFKVTLSGAEQLQVLGLTIDFTYAGGWLGIGFAGPGSGISIPDYGVIAPVMGVLAGVLVGYVNGILIARIGIPSFIATLGTQFFWAGTASVLSGGKSYALRGAEQSWVWNVVVGRPFGPLPGADWLSAVPLQSLWTAAIVVLLWFILNRHRFGEHVLFIGDSNEVSRVVGINVAREKIKLFTLMGALAGVAAIMLTLENKNFFGNQGQGYLLLAIASVLIGGTSIFGGRATLIGTVFGCLIITMLEPGLVATGLTGSWVLTIRGLVFLTAIVFYLVIDQPGRRLAFLVRLPGLRKTGGESPTG
jgi:simple sugar transport system permease protein